MMKAEMQTTLGIVAFSVRVKVASASKPGIPPYECNTGTTDVAPWATASTTACFIAAISALRTSDGGEVLTEGSLGVEIVYPADWRILTRGSQC